MPRAALAPAFQVRLARRGWTSGLALGGYASIAFLYFGVRLLFHGGRTYVGRGSDPQIFIWAFAWFPHAILNGQDPFYTHAIWAPTGDNLAWATSTPGLALAFAPLTLLLGPVASFDIASVLLPALAAWTAFLLCRYVTRALWPSLVGGYLFGFSAYMLGQIQAHLHLTSVFLIPLVALVLLRYVQGELTGRGLTLRLGVLIGLELTFSTEVAFTLTLVLLITLVLAYVLVPASRRRLRSLGVPLVGSYALAAVLASPLLYVALTSFRSNPVNPVSPTEFSSDLLSFVVPTDLVATGTMGWAHRITSHFTGDIEETGGYLGVPALLMVVWFAVRSWRRASARFLLAAVLVTAFVSLGAWLHVDGHKVITLPWEHIGYRPLFDNVLPVRLSVYVALGVSVIVAAWAASRGIPVWVRVLLPALAVLAVVPNLNRSTWATTTQEPPFITDGTYKSCLRPGDNVLVFPWGRQADAMLWQADTGFRFRMAAGYIAPVPPKAFRQPPGVAQLATYGTVPAGKVAPLLQYVRLKHVTVLVVEVSRKTVWLHGHYEGWVDPWPALLRRVAKPQAVGGVLVYRLNGPPTCPAPA